MITPQAELTERLTQLSHRLNCLGEGCDHAFHAVDRTDGREMAAASLDWFREVLSGVSPQVPAYMGITGETEGFRVGYQAALQEVRKIMGITA